MGENWLLICNEDLQVTRADSIFEYCPFCGDSLN